MASGSRTAGPATGPSPDPGLRARNETGTGVWGRAWALDFSLPGGPLKDTANTDVVALRDQLFALWYESGSLYALDPQTLETKGIETMDGRLPRRVSAHSKMAPNGDFIFFRYGDRPPYMTYGVARPDGTVHAVDITLPGPRRPHDIGVTPRFSVLHDFPIFFDPELFKKTGKRIPLFHPDVPTRYGVIPRSGTDADVRWFEFAPCYMLHVVNCWEEGDEIVMVGCRTDDPSLKPDRRDEFGRHALRHQVAGQPVRMAHEPRHRSHLGAEARRPQRRIPTHEHELDRQAEPVLLPPGHPLRDPGHLRGRRQVRPADRHLGTPRLRTRDLRVGECPSHPAQAPRPRTTAT